MLLVTLLYVFAVFWRSVQWRRLHSGGSISECCRSHCSTHSLYSGGQYVGRRCTLEVALVNAVGHVAVHVCCSLRLLHNLLAAAEGSRMPLARMQLVATTLRRPRQQMTKMTLGNT